jgi:hypothetical protein
MALKICKTYKDHCKFVDDQGNVINKYDEFNDNLSLVFEDDNKQMIIPAEDISLDQSGNIFFEIDDTKYIIDDGYRNILVKAGYIIAEGYDKEKFTNEITGSEDLISRIRIDFSNALEKVEALYEDGQMVMDEDGNLRTKKDLYEISRTDHSFSITTRGWKENLVGCTISKMISINMDRKMNEQSYYPYDKDIDKYSALFIAVYGEKQKEDAESAARFKIPEGIIHKILKIMNEDQKDINYVFKCIECKRRVIDNGINVIK